MSPTITLQLRAPDREPEIVTLGPGRTMLGRESGDVLLHDPEASALHAELEFTKGAVIVRDLGSRNGTWREGERYPQFALYRGQSFRCGATEITLVDIADVPSPRVGDTAIGRDEPGGSSGTQPPSSPPGEHAGSTPTQPMGSPTTTVAAGSGPPPEGAASVAAIPSSAIVAAPSASAPPRRSPSGPDPAAYVSPAASTQGPVAPAAHVFPAASAPGPVAPAAHVFPAASAPMPVVPTAHVPTAASAPMPVVPTAHVPAAASAPSPAAPPPPGAPAPVMTTHSAPVSNAVIKIGDARPHARPRAPRGATDSRGPWLKRLLVGTLLVGALGGLAFALYGLLAGRGAAFVQALAGELPPDTIGVLALSSPRAALERLDDEVPPSIRERATEALGLDPFEPQSLAAWGIDLDAPAGLGLLDGEGATSLSLGLSDEEALRAALSGPAAKLFGADEELRWVERSFGETAGLWLDEPVAVAALFPAGRVIFVTGANAEELARHAAKIAETEPGHSLADRPGLGELAPPSGEPLMGLYLDGASGRAAIPGRGAEAMAIRMALADVDGFVVLLADDGPAVHVSIQTVVREGAAVVAMLEDARRGPELFEDVPGPVLAGLDAAVSSAYLEHSLTAARALGVLDDAALQEFRDQTGLDLRGDILDNLDGRFGVTLRPLPVRDPGEAQGEEDDPAMGVVMVAGVEDEADAKVAAERFFGKMQGELGLKLEQIEGTTVYVVDDHPRLAYFVDRGRLWAARGDVDLAALLADGQESFLRGPRVPAIEHATAPGGLLAGFVDLPPVFEQLRASAREGEPDPWERWAPVIEPLEALTLRGELDARTFEVRVTLNTSADPALSRLLQALLKVAGAGMVEQLTQQRRARRCEALIEHILELTRADASGADYRSELLERRSELRTECVKAGTSDTEIDCMLAATNLQAVTQCQDAAARPPEDDGGVTPVDVLGQAEPSPVPYVDDIWPHTRSAGTDRGRPDAAVNYAVGLGDDSPTRGAEDALVTVVMFGDFQCPYCKRVLPTLDALLAKDREVRLVFRHNPLPMHPEAEGAARAAVAAGEQGQFWAMHDALYDDQDALGADGLGRRAEAMGLDRARFDRDRHDAATAARVAADVAAAKRFGATGTPSFFVNGRYLAGAQPLHAFEALVAEEKARAERFVERRGNTRKRLYADMLTHFAPEVIATPAAPTAEWGDEERHVIDTTGLPRRGDSGLVRVELVECGDLDCPFCKRATTTLDRILDEYGGKVALFWLHNPLASHKGAEPAARAAAAAHEQGKFWEMHDALFEDATLRSDPELIALASKLGLDTARFERDLHDPRIAARVTEQQKICADNNARGTPTFYINGRRLPGAQSFDKFQRVIDQELSGGI